MAACGSSDSKEGSGIFNHCKDLQDVCEKCSDDFTRGLCQAVVDAGDRDSCNKAVGDYEAAGCQ